MSVTEPCLNVQLKDVLKKKYKNARYTKHQGHTEWVRQGRSHRVGQTGWVTQSRSHRVDTCE